MYQIATYSSHFHYYKTFENILFIFLVVLYAVSAVYFAGVMVRLMLTLTPVVCILAAIGISSTLDHYLNDKDEVVTAKKITEGTTKKKKKEVRTYERYETNNPIQLYF